MVRFDAQAAMIAPGLMLHLLRSGAPNDEILKAKTLEDYAEIAARHGIAMPNQSCSSSGTSAGSSALCDASATSSVSGPAAIPSGAPPSILAQPEPGYEVRRFTAPPSAYEEAGVSSAALTRARLRREQLAQERGHSRPMGT